MKPLTIVFLAALALQAVATAAPTPQEWPRKGDRLFVAATFDDAIRMYFGSRYVDMPLASCTELVMKDPQPNKPRWTVESAGLGVPLRLDGPWLSWMHKTQEDCKSRLATEGQPKVKRSGRTFTIIAADGK